MKNHSRPPLTELARARAELSSSLALEIVERITGEKEEAAIARLDRWYGVKEGRDER